MKKKVLICGATGFIGRNLTEHFSKKGGYEVYAVYNKRSPWWGKEILSVHADLINPQEVNSAVKDMDIIIQAAATTSGVQDIMNRPYIHVTDNAVMNSFIFRAAHEYKVKHVVFFSCSVMYQSSDSPVREEDFNGNIFPKYFGVGWTKVYIEKMAEFYSRLGHTKFTVIRHSNIYGPYDKFDLERSHVFGATITKVLTAKNNGITIWGKGEEERDLLYVDDLVNFVALALEKQQNLFELVNVGYGRAISVIELVQKIIKLSGKKLSIEHDLSKPTIPTHLCLDISKAKRIYNWEPQISLDLGIQKTIDWYKNEGRFSEVR
ncbi:MAG: NAD-dependent epimerase/dehydratase family protein [Candidatus Omnitrophica bacterium]|nr:NAD-dependent epimerase/dehydratase family protein [Candidatus Omnitrophota bacterium]